MIQVSGKTYRLVEAHERLEVFRVSDDKCVGAFKCWPTLCVLESNIVEHDLLDIAHTALRSGRLPWESPHALSARPSLLGYEKLLRAMTDALPSFWPHGWHKGLPQKT